MFAAEYYQGIYLFIVTFFTFFVLSRYKFQMVDLTFQSGGKGYFAALCFTLCMIVFIGLRPISGVFADMTGYANAMLDHRYEYMAPSWDSNYIFQPLMAFLSSHGAHPQTPILILAVINFGATFFAIKKMFPNDVMLMMLVYCGALTTFGGATNGLKSGCAMSIFLLALAYREKIFWFAVFLFLSMGFHHAMQLPIVACLICFFYKDTRVYMIIWLFCLLLALFHVTYFMGIFGDWTDEHGAEYLYTEAGSTSSTFGGKTGFRYDFVLYSLVPIVIGWITLRNRRELSQAYTFILNVYLLTNAIWMLCMYAEYTNRIANLSWGLYPILILYPFLKREWGTKNYKSFYYITIGHLAFTVLMFFLYL